MSTETILGTALAALLNSLWQSAAIALLVWTALRFLPRAGVKINAATRCAVWWAVLAAVVLLPMAREQRIAIETADAAPYEAESVPAPAALEPAPPIQIESAPAASHTMGPLQITAGAGLLAIFAIWSVLSLFRIAQIVRSYRFLRGIKQRSRAVTPQQLVNFDYWLLACSVDRTARLLVSSEIVSPMAVGFRRPAVIVPETLLNEFTAEELDHVILHELAHIARYDDWTNLFARLIGALLPIHPVAVWLIKRIEQDREIACDDWVVAMTGEPRPYAASLTRLFELCSARRRQLLATGMADRASHLGERIEALLRAGRDFAPRVSLVRVALGAVVLVGLVLAGAHAPHWIAFAQEPRVTPLPEIAPLAPVPATPPLPRVAQRAPTPRLPQAPQVAQTPQLPQAPQVAQTPQLPQAPQAPIATQDFLRQEFEARQQQLKAELDRLREMQKQFADQNRRYTGDHPEMRALADQIAAMEAQIRARGAQAQDLQAQLRAQEAQMRAERANRAPNDSFLAALVAAGYGGISVDDIIDLRNHGVSAEFLRSVSQTGQSKLSTKELITLAENGVHPGFFRAMRQAFPQISVREIVEAAQNGLNEGDLRQAKEFSPSLTLPQIIKLKQAGVI